MPGFAGLLGQHQQRQHQRQQQRTERARTVVRLPFASATASTGMHLRGWMAWHGSVTACASKSDQGQPLAHISAGLRWRPLRAV